MIPLPWLKIGGAAVGVLGLLLAILEIDRRGYQRGFAKAELSWEKRLSEARAQLAEAEARNTVQSRTIAQMTLRREQQVRERTFDPVVIYETPPTPDCPGVPRVSSRVLRDARAAFNADLAASLSGSPGGSDAAGGPHP